MVEAQCSPCIALTRLDDSIRIAQCRFKRILTHSLPVLFCAVESAHVVQINISNFRFVFPAVATLHHALNTCSVVPIYTAEHSVGGDFTCFLWRKSSFYQAAFHFHHTGIYLVFVHIIGSCGRHFHRPTDKEQPRSCNVAELSAGLNHYVDTRTA